MLQQNALFLCIPDSYLAGWTLAIQYIGVMESGAKPVLQHMAMSGNFTISVGNRRWRWRSKNEAGGGLLLINK